MVGMHHCTVHDEQQLDQQPLYKRAPGRAARPEATRLRCDWLLLELLLVTPAGRLSTQCVPVNVAARGFALWRASANAGPTDAA